MIQRYEWDMCYKECGCSMIPDKKGRYALYEDAAKEIKRLRTALRDLVDEQNGPPLSRRQAEWEAAMAVARGILKAADAEGG